MIISPLIDNGYFAKVIQRRIRLSVGVFLSAVQFNSLLNEVIHHPALLGLRTAPKPSTKISIL
jgi:hypothetical protein